MPSDLNPKLIEAFRQFVAEKCLDLAEEPCLEALLRLCVDNINIPASRRYRLREDCFHAPYTVMQKQFGRSYKDVLKRTGLLRIVGDYSKKDKLTYPYQVTNRFYTLFHEFCDTQQLLQTAMHKPDRLPALSRPQSAIVSLDSREGDNKRKTTFQLDPFVPINLARFSNVHLNYQQWRDERSVLLSSAYTEENQERIRELDRWMGSLNLLLMHVGRNNETRELVLIEQYQEDAIGRLYAKGFSLQTVPKEVRKAVFTGYTDWDFQACHPAIIAGLMKKYGKPTPNLDAYVSLPNPIRSKIAEDLGLDASDIKWVITTVMYGASLTEKEGNIIFDELGLEQLRDLKSHWLFMGLAREVKQSRLHLLKRYRKTTQQGKVIRNILGKDLIKRDGESLKQFAHVIQGYEVKMLEILMQNFSDDDGVTRNVVLIQHDGFTTRTENLEGLSAGMERIRDELGLDMELTHEKLA